MVLIPALVVQPGPGISHVLPLRSVRTPVALVVPDAGPEFLRAVLGKIVCQSLPIQADFKTVPANQAPVFCNGAIMPPYILNFHS